MVTLAALPFTESARLVAFISIASLVVIVGAVVVLAMCWIALRRR